MCTHGVLEHYRNGSGITLARFRDDFFGAALTLVALFLPGMRDIEDVDGGSTDAGRKVDQRANSAREVCLMLPSA
jgi:hypothetical protein